MEDNELLKYSEKLQQLGQEVLAETGIIKDLSRFGKVNIHGGFSYNLLLKPDIDVHLIAPDYKNEMAEVLAAKLIKENKYVEVLYIDHNKHNPSITADTGRVYPDGHFIGLKYFYKGTMWAIDIFLLQEEQKEIEKLQSFFDNKCTSRIRLEILKSKKYISDNKINYPAKKLYDMFIAGEVKSSKEFEETLKNEKI